MKLLLWVLIGLVIVLWLMRGKKHSARADASAADAAGAGKNAEPMIQCAHCGMHVPASESVTGSSGAVFCSEEHRLRHAAS